MSLDPHSLHRLEFGRVLAAISEHAESSRARALLVAWRPIPDAAVLARECGRLAEAVRRQSEPGPWCAVGPGSLAERLEHAEEAGLDGLALRDVLAWLEAAALTREAWSDAGSRERHPALAALADSVPLLAELRERLARCIEPDGRVADNASPALARARGDLARGERELERQLARWVKGFGENAYVTRHGDRFVALVPAAGFPRRRGIVHDVSASGQSLFVEPLEACEANNHLIECRATATEEERRILAELAGEVYARAGELEAAEGALAALDTLRARARWARTVDALALEPGGARLRLVRARHPLLAMGERASEVVPLDLELGPRDRLLLVSGPNMGGKTVLLKTVGLAVALAHSALPVPAAEGSEVPAIEHLLADLGDEQSVDEGLSTFAAHLRGLREMVERAGPRTLVLCDELGAGTDPDEGAALGRALVERFAQEGTWGVVTTHLGSLKRLAGEIPGVVNGSLEFDAETFTSRYRFLPGVPGASHALSVAERLGFPAEVVARAREMTPEATRAVERLLADLEARRTAVEAERAALAAALESATAAEQRHREAREHALRTLEETRRSLGRDSEAVLAQVRELWQAVQREAKRAEKDRKSSEALKAEIASGERALAAIHERAAAAAEAAGGSRPPARLDRVEVGQRVRVSDLGVEAEVASLPDAEGRLTLRRGSWNIQSHVARLEPVEAAAPRPARGAAPAATWQAQDDALPLEVDLRGMEVDEALSALDAGLDRAVLGGLGEVRVVHGIGRGVLRAAVERHLRGHPQVASQRMGMVGEGGRGVTVAKLR